MATTQDLLRQRFAELCAERDGALEKIKPLRVRRDQIVQDFEQALAKKIGPLDEQIASVEAPLAAIHNEIAQISLALNGQTAA